MQLLGLLIFGASIVGMTVVESELGIPNQWSSKYFSLIQMIVGHGNLNFLFFGPIAFGGIIVFISFFGCCGACFKNRCMLMTVSDITKPMFV